MKLRKKEKITFMPFDDKLFSILYRLRTTLIYKYSKGSWGLTV